MHLFHKWKTISKRKTTITETILGRYVAKGIPAIVELQKCKECSKERAFVIKGNNLRTEVNPDLWFTNKDREIYKL